VPRPKSRRFIHEPPLFDSFKPIGVRSRDLEELDMSLDELEALRLADKEGLTQDEAAGQMAISRSTFSRLVESARRKSAEFLLDGRHLVISGGPVHFRRNRLRCRNCGRVLPADFHGGPKACDRCGSTDLTDLAGGFGHGECCTAEDGSGPTAKEPRRGAGPGPGGRRGGANHHRGGR
jgi:uncharacterized protein